MASAFGGTGMVVRRLSVLDAMILVAATAMGLAGIRACSPAFYSYQYTPITPPPWLNWLAVVLSNWAFYVSPLPAAWTLAAMVLRLRSPRPPMRRLMRQPGAVAVLAATMLVLIGVVHYLLDLHNPSLHDIPYQYTSFSLGCGVGSAWWILALGKRWRAEPSWIDRFGRALGAYWVGMVPLILFRTYGQI
jgi:hypothetical protein